MSLRFNVTHWPYIHTRENYHCVQKFFTDSYINLSLDLATLGYTVSMAVLAFAIHAMSW